MNKNFLMPIVGSVFLLLACRSASDSSCLSVSEEWIAKTETSSFAQGGYIQFGDSACSATIDVLSASKDEIKLRAYSARHCRLEYGTLVVQPSLHLYFDKTNENASGYVKNIAVREDFTERARGLLNELEKLGLSEPLRIRFFEALRVDTHPLFDEVAPISSSPEAPASKDPSKRDPNLLACLQPQAPKLPSTFYGSDICWSALDLGIFDLEVRRSENNSEKFDFIAKHLTAKQEQLKKYLSARPRLDSFYNEQRKDFANLRSEIRLHRYSQLGYLLSFDHCKIAQNERGLSDEICRNHSKIFDLVGQYMNEPNSNGRISIFDRLATEKSLEMPGVSLAELKSGRRIAANNTPRTFEEAGRLSRIYSTGMFTVMRNSLSVSMRKMLSSLRDNSIESDKTGLSSQLIVNSNLKQPDERGFTQFPLTSISRNPRIMQIAQDTSNADALQNSVHGLSLLGTLRVGIAQADQKITFQDTDSGSLVTFAGIVPLMVLNTIDGNGVSGGASILALPEAGPEESTSAGKTADQRAPTGNPKSKAKPTLRTACR